MRPRATADLAQLPDKEFFEQVSRGMVAVLTNARTLIADAQLLAEEGRNHSRDIVRAIAEEEAAKYHILLDAVRTPRSGTWLSRQLKRFNSHLAKGIYARYTNTSPATYGETLKFAELYRQELYLDGPNDIDWIFRNQILQGREEAMYVDYVETDEGHAWLVPAPIPTMFSFSVPASIAFASTLSAAGFDSPAALALIAKLWREVTFEPDDHWQLCWRRNGATLQALHEAGLLTDAGAAEAAEIAWRWLFPLWGADLTLIQVSRDDLRSSQASWRPDW